jgi:radical SAM-linked protein
MRIRVYFAKTEAMQYTGHLDLHRAWERTFRRACLPLAYSQGFHPQPKLHLACALPLGFTSLCEAGDFWLEKTLPLEEIEAALVRALPPGIEILRLDEVEGHAPALSTQVQSTEYTVTLLDRLSNLEERLARLLEAKSLPRQRRGKSYDLRPLLEEIHSLPDDKIGMQRILLRLTARQAATGRPEEVLAELGLGIEAARIQRTKLIFMETTSKE